MYIIIRTDTSLILTPMFKDVRYSRAAPAQIYAKPNQNPNLSQSSAGAVLLPGEATIVITEMTEMQVAAHDANMMPYL